MIDQEFVKYIVTSLVSQPDQVKVDRTVDERGVLLTLHVAEVDLGRVIGRKGSTAQSLRVLLRALGSKNEAHYNLRIADDNQSAPRDRSDRPQPATKADQSEVAQSDDVNIDQADGFAQSEESSTQTSESNNSLADQTKKELDDLNDLDL